MMAVGILGLQGAVQEHIPHLAGLGAQHRVVRDKTSLAQVQRLIIPGGESTVMLKFLREFDMLSLLLERIAAGLPVWGICAGAIALSAEIDGQAGPIGALPAAITRNAYGRQSASRQYRLDIPLFDAHAYPAIFIRAPRIDRVREDVQVHAILKAPLSFQKSETYPPAPPFEKKAAVYEPADPVFVQHGRIMATTFHPELNRDDRFHRYFLSL
jgi:pyridoxal 5'-phosphate synthase pdxT subunit